ncbi:MAG: hypothetical protein A4E58_01395 [Syntrophorhabdus sp. PtaB.Bin006]|nr:MAG: hypothetical protein A4E58_01395 [Syntrophorhabdus sp. PtaB.Bin006]
MLRASYPIIDSLLMRQPVVQGQYRMNTVSLPASLRVSYPLETRIVLNFANSSYLWQDSNMRIAFQDVYSRLQQSGVPCVDSRVGPKRARRRDSRKVLPALCPDLALYLFGNTLSILGLVLSRDSPPLLVLLLMMCGHQFVDTPDPVC